MAEQWKGKIIVLDDDPTGIQTVHDVSVYTDWEKESIAAGFAEEQSMFYILTNSRSFTKEQTTKCHQQIIRRIIEVAEESGQDFLIVSRGDSTLRGHYPLETEILRAGLEGLGRLVDGEVICPFFAEGGRFTIDNIHYVKSGEELIPAGETEFAKDRTFGYRSSNLTNYIEEKTEGKYLAKDVCVIDLEDLRAGNVEKITGQLMQVHDFNKIVVNAASYEHLEVFMKALYKALGYGKRYLYRTAASFVKVIGNITARPLLTRVEMVSSASENGGIIVVGSHTAKTTAQLEQLKEVPGLTFVQFDSDTVLEEEAFQLETSRVQKQLDTCIKDGRTAVVYTKRKVL
ncbi:uncharacterized protein YgbK (DUF1537 family) [Lachnospiraceae bacterium PFB1-21]